MASLFRNIRSLSGWVASLLAGLLRLYTCTLRVKVIDESGLFERCGKSPAVLALWHNRLLLAAPNCPLKLRKVLLPLISASRDGGYISDILEKFSYVSIRGSSSKYGARALVEMEQVLAENKMLVLTIDGPRGPKYTVHPGAVALAQKTHADLIPVVSNSRHHWTLKSWDRLQIPWPFTYVELIFCAPLPVDDCTVAEGNERLRQKLMSMTIDTPEEWAKK
jgi:hypothetical protein